MGIRRIYPENRNVFQKIKKIFHSNRTETPFWTIFPTFNSEKIENRNQPKGYQKSEVREKKGGINWNSIEIFKFQFLSKSVENFKS